MCNDDDDLGKAPGRAPIGQEELGFFATLKVEDEGDMAHEKRSGIAEPSASEWAEVDGQQSDPASRKRRGVVLWIVLVALASLAACAWILLAGAG